MDREELDKAIEKAGSLLSVMKREDDDQENFLRDNESKLGEILEENNRLEKSLTSLSDMNTDDDLTIKLVKKSLQSVEDAATKASSIIDNNQKWLRLFKLETSTIQRMHEETLRKVTANFHRGPAMFSGGTLKRDIKALSEEIDDVVENQVTRRREICKDLESILKGPADQTYACGLSLGDQLCDLNEDISELDQVIKASEEKISRLDEELKTLME